MDGTETLSFDVLLPVGRSQATGSHFPYRRRWAKNVDTVDSHIKKKSNWILFVSYSFARTYDGGGFAALVVNPQCFGCIGYVLSAFQIGDQCSGGC